MLALEAAINACTVCTHYLLQDNVLLLVSIEDLLALTLDYSCIHGQNQLEPSHDTIAKSGKTNRS